MCSNCAKKINTKKVIHYTDVCGNRIFCSIECAKSFINDAIMEQYEIDDISDLIIKVDPIKKDD